MSGKLRAPEYQNEWSYTGCIRDLKDPKLVSTSASQGMIS